MEIKKAGEVMVSLIVVDYKSIDRTLNYIKHVYENTTNIDMLNYVIVDNYIQSNALEILNQKYVIIKTAHFVEKTVYLFDTPFGVLAYCNSGENLGYAKGNNLGIRISDSLFEDSYYIVSNNDLLFKNKLDWRNIQGIYDNDDKICVIGPQIQNLDGKYQSPNKKLSAYNVLIHQYFVDFRPFKWGGDLDYSFESKICYRVSGCFMIIKADLFKEAGMFDENTFLFAEEMILSERLNRIGAKVYFYNDFHLLHNHSITIKANSSSYQARIWCYESYVHYFKTYRNTSSVLLRCSKYIFKVYILRKKLRSFLKEIIKYNKA